MSREPSPLELVDEFGKSLASLIEKGRKRYRVLRAGAAVLAVLFALILGSIVGSSIPLSTAVVSQAAQSLIGVDGFLAGASGVIAFFYYGRLFEFLSPSASLMVAMRSILGAEFAKIQQVEFEKSLKAIVEKFSLPRALNEQETTEARKLFMDSFAIMVKQIFDKTGKLVSQLTAPARRMAYYAAFVMGTLVVSAFFSILGILSGSAPYLGAGFGFTVLGSGFLALAWSDAHVNLSQFLIAVQAHETLITMPPPPSKS